MQRIIYSIVSLLIMGVLFVFLFPLFIIIAVLILVIFLIGMFTGRASFRVYTPPKHHTQEPPQRAMGSVIDITDDQEK